MFYGRLSRDIYNLGLAQLRTLVEVSHLSNDQGLITKDFLPTLQNWSEGEDGFSHRFL